MNDGTVWMPRATLEALKSEMRVLETCGTSATQAENARLAECRQLVRAADTAAKPNDGLVEPGMLVTIRLGTDAVQTFLFADRSVLGEPTALSPRSPLGQAVNGHRVGEVLTYTAPSGSVVVEIVAATPAT